MPNNLTCDECTAIAQEIKDAYREMWLTAPSELRDAWMAIAQLAGGTEEDVLRAEELIPKAQVKISPRIGNAIRRKLLHQVRSGHKVPQ